MRVRRSGEKLLVDLAVRRCAGMQPAAVGSLVPPRGEKGREKARRIRLSALLLLLVGKGQGNDQSTTGGESRGSDQKEIFGQDVDRMKVSGPWHGAQAR